MCPTGKFLKTAQAVYMPEMNYYDNSGVEDLNFRCNDDPTDINGGGGQNGDGKLNFIISNERTTTLG